MSHATNNPSNFANRPTEEVRAIASKGGHASAAHASTNPGNFANRPTEEVRAIASKGGHASHHPHPPQSQTQHQPHQSQEHHYNLRSSDNSLKPGHGNPGNFANRPSEEVRAIAHAGGVASRESGKPGNFKNRDPAEVREIAMMGVEKRREMREEELQQGKH